MEHLSAAGHRPASLATRHWWAPPSASAIPGRVAPLPSPAVAPGRFLAPAIVSILFTLSACGGESIAQSRTGEGLVTSGEIPEVLATVGGDEITLADIRARVGDQLDQLDMQYLRARSRTVESALETLLRERVLLAEARRRGMSVDELVSAEAGGSFDPSPVEVETWYRENQGRLGGRSLDEIRSQIADHLRDLRHREAASRLEARLFEERRVVIHFEPFRLALHNEDAPFAGPRDAPVTLVTFSDFECPYCAQLVPTLKRLTETFGDDVRIVYRQFPIPSLHPGAFKAAEASLCAHEQGRFWEMHDLMFAEMRQLAVDDLKEKARRIGLDGRRFDECLDSGRHVEQVQSDMREASRMGVTGTPALFINGVQLEGGAVPFETAAAAVRKELARLGNR
jgi:predicted DsbA family dithiol-disulfide isomerase